VRMAKAPTGDQSLVIEESDARTRQYRTIP
jgi:hypothetical protein